MCERATLRPIDAFARGRASAVAAMRVAFVIARGGKELFGDFLGTFGEDETHAARLSCASFVGGDGAGPSVRSETGVGACVISRPLR